MTRERARRWYRLLLRFLPRDMRERFGSDMELLFADRLAELEGHRAAQAGLWAAAVADVISQGARERGARVGDAIGGLLRDVTRLDGWWQDVRFGTRTLMRRPGFTIAAVLTLTLGMGANVAIFSVVNGVLLRPLPYPSSEALVSVFTVNRRTGEQDASQDHPDLRLWQSQIPGFQVAGYSGGSRTLTGFGDPEVVQGVRVTDGLITLMGYQPFLGRDLVSADDVPDGPRVVVVSYRFWQERLGQDQAAIGRTITLNAEPWEIVGVAPEGFSFPAGSEVWEPRLHQAEGCSHGCDVLRVIGRIEPGTTFETVDSRLVALSSSLAASFPDLHRDDVTRIERLIDTQVAGVRDPLWVLMGAVGMVLLIACANVANLMLLRANARSAEVTLRATLGASRGRIVRQLLTESMIIAGSAGTLGLVLAYWSTRALLRLAPESLPRMSEVGVDGGVLLFAAGLVVAVTALFGTLPALQSTARNLTEGVATGLRATRRRGTGFSRSALLAAEIALCLALLLGAGLLLRTLRAVGAVDYGFAATAVERFRIATPESRYDADATVRFQEDLEERLAALAGVEAVGFGFGAPLAIGGISTNARLLDRPEVPEVDLPSFDIRPSTPGFLSASGMRLLRGRWFTREDRREKEGVAVINESGARLHYPGSDPVGKQIQADIGWGYDSDPVRTIVGVVADARVAGATSAPEPAMYFPNAQFAANSIWVYMRLADGLSTVMPGVRDVLRDLDPQLAITQVSRIEDAVARDQASTRFYSTLLSVFSLLALILAAVGLYAVVAYAASQRTREIGIRMALGARKYDVERLVLQQGAGPALLGTVLGLGIFWLGSGAIESLLFGVAPTDPTTVLVATGVLLAVVMLACFIPATRASRIPPSSALGAD